MFPARDFIRQNPETVQDLLPAGLARHAEARALVEAHPTGATYLAGYAVEMVLKHAALRTEGLLPHVPVFATLPAARQRLRVWLGDVDHDGYHSLEFWSLLLRETFRHRRGEVPALVAQASRRAALLHHGWSVALRYRDGIVSGVDAAELVSAAGWFVAQQEDLWS